MSENLKPEIITAMSDEELRRRMDTLEWKINQERRKQRDSKYLEVDFCYLYRELEFRRLRSQVHAEYIRNLSSHSSGRPPKSTGKFHRTPIAAH